MLWRIELSEKWPFPPFLQHGSVNDPQFFLETMRTFRPSSIREGLRNGFVAETTLVPRAEAAPTSIKRRIMIGRIRRNHDRGDPVARLRDVRDHDAQFQSVPIFWKFGLKVPMDRLKV